MKTVFDRFVDLEPDVHRVSHIDAFNHQFLDESHVFLKRLARRLFLGCVAQHAVENPRKTKIGRELDPRDRDETQTRIVYIL